VASRVKPPFASTTVGLAVGVTAAVVLACAGGAFLYSQRHMQSLLEMARSSALSEGNLIRVALEHQMIENQRTLIAKMIESFRQQSRVERLVLLDRSGVERYPAGNGARTPNCKSARQPARPATAIRRRREDPAASSRPAAAKCCEP